MNEFNQIRFEMEDQIMCFDMKNNLDTNCCHHPPPHDEEVDNLEKVVLEQLEPLRHSVATVEKIGTRSKTAKCLLMTCKDILFLRECFIRLFKHFHSGICSLTSFVVNSETSKLTQTLSLTSLNFSSSRCS